MPAHKVEVSLLGQTFSVITQEDPKHVHQSAERVQQQIDELRASGMTASSDRLLSLVALNLAGELIKQEANGSGNLDDIITKLDALVEQANSLAKVPLR